MIKIDRAVLAQAKVAGGTKTSSSSTSNATNSVTVTISGG